SPGRSAPRHPGPGPSMDLRPAGGRQRSDRLGRPRTLLAIETTLLAPIVLLAPGRRPSPAAAATAPSPSPGEGGPSGEASSPVCVAPGSEPAPTHERVSVGETGARVRPKSEVRPRPRASSSGWRDVELRRLARQESPFLHGQLPGSRSPPSGPPPPAGSVDRRVVAPHDTPASRSGEPGLRPDLGGAPWPRSGRHNGSTSTGSSSSGVRASASPTIRSLPEPYAAERPHQDLAAARPLARRLARVV